MKTKARKRQSKCHLVARPLFSSALLLPAIFAGWSARAQEGLTDAMADEAAARVRANQEQSNYTFRSGDFRMLMAPSLSMQWNDNINCASTGQENDFIILPTLGVVMSYPLTQRNLLQLNVTAGYSEYVKHSNLSSFYMSAGSGLSFDVYIRDIIINLHDQFSYIQNSAANPQVADTGTYGTFNNTAGLSGQWSLRTVDFTLGYDHQTSIATSSQFSSTDNSTEAAYAQAGYKLNSRLTTGGEGSFSYTAYSQNVLNDATSYSLGVYGDWHPDAFIEVEPRVGYTINQFSQTSYLQTSDLNSWYADLLVMHKITRSLSYSIDAGRNVSGAAQASADQYWFVNAGITWSFIRNFSFQPRFSFQNGKQGAGTTVNPGFLPFLPPSVLTQTENYDWYSASLGFAYDISQRFTVGWNYQFTKRTSSIAGRGYTQNVIGIQISYHPI